MEKKASYILTAYSFLSTHSLDELLDVGYQIRKGKPTDDNLLRGWCLGLSIFLSLTQHLLSLSEKWCP